MSKQKYNKTFAVDTLTGKVIGEITPIDPPRHRKEAGFYMSDKKWSERLAADKDLRGQTTAVLLYMLSQIESGNRVLVSPTHVSKILGMHRISVYDALNKLIEKKIITKDKKSGVRGVYFFNPNYFWCGERERAAKAYNEGSSEPH